MQSLQNPEPFVRALGAVVTFVGGVVVMFAAMIVYPPQGLSLLVQVLAVVSVQMLVASLPKVSWQWEPLVIGVVFAIGNALTAGAALYLADAWTLGITLYLLGAVFLVQGVRSGTIQDFLKGLNL